MHAGKSQHPLPVSCQKLI
jgi:ribulose-5-phosphate 4-epimerase/fuculose-1-phosphate aldolase